MKTYTRHKHKIRAIALTLALSTVLLAMASVPAFLRASGQAEPIADARPPDLSPAVADSSLNVEFIGQVGGGPTFDVAVQGGYAYIGAGLTLAIVNVADKAHPVLASQTSPLPDIVAGVTVSGTYAYIADGYGGLGILDISNPTHPHSVGFYQSWDAHAKGVAVQGNTAYVASWLGLHVVDVSDPANPQRLGFLSTPRMAFNVAVAGNYAYVAVDRRGLWVVDISNPSDPRQVGSASGDPFDVAVAGHYAYVADYSGLRVVDIFTPTNPTKVSLFDTPGTSFGVAVANNHAYLANNYGLSIIDVSEPLTPTQTGYYSLTGQIVDVAFAGGYAYAADQNHRLHIINVTDPAHPTETGSFDNLPGDSRHVLVAGGHAYVADGVNGLRVVRDVGWANPTQFGFDTPGHAMDIALVGNYAYIADGESGLRIVDVGNPTNLHEIGSASTPGYAWGAAIAEPYAYVADGKAGLRVLNVFDRAHPTEISAVEMPGEALGVMVVGNYAYVADGSGGLRIVRINKPDDPREVGVYDAPGSATAVAVVAPYAYVADGDKGLRIINISDPTHPVEVGAWDTPGSATGITVRGDYAYIADGYASGLRVIHIADPAHPTEVGFYDSLADTAYGVDVEAGSGNAYLADGSGGLAILHFQPGPPKADFYANPTSGKRPLTVFFTDTSLGGPDAWGWSFGEGGISAAQNPTHTFTAAGVYTVSLRAYNAIGSDTLTRTNYITVSGPSAAFGAAPTFGNPPLTVTFANQSTGNYTSSLWDFGDGVTSTLDSPTHTFAAMGVYAVTLTVSGSEGGDTLSKPAFIAVLQPSLYLPIAMNGYQPPKTGPRYVAASGADTGNDCALSARPCATIQHAVDVAAAGDEIRIASARYTDVHVRPRNEVTTTGVVTQIVYLDKSVTLVGGYTTANWSVPDPKVHHTILDAQGQGRGIYITGGISPKVEGLDITGGDATGMNDYCDGSRCYGDGGGVFAITATVTLSGCRVYNNTAWSGGGVGLSNNSANLTGNTIEGNVAWYGGGGASLESSDATLSGNTLLNNAATWWGGGVYLSGSPAVLSGNAILSNTSHYADGGGVYLTASDAMLLNNTIQGNASDGADIKFAHGGGGVYLSSGNATLGGNTIQSNTAQLSGGGVYLADTATLNGNLIASNTGDGVYLLGNVSLLSGNTLLHNAGDGVHLSRSDATLINNVIADSDGDGISIYGGNPQLIYNTVAHNGGDTGVGVYVSSYVDYSQQYSSSVALTNTILVNHSVGISVTGGNAAIVNGVLWFGTPITVSQAATATVTVQNQHEDDPAFVNPAGGDYHIRLTSAAVNQGMATEYPLDMDGDYRVLAAPPDLGADEVISLPPVCHARLNGNKVYTSLQAAIQASASASDVIEVAGVCEDAVAWNGNTYAAVLTRTVTVRGGYSLNFVYWDPTAYPTVLNGHLRGGGLAIGAGASPTVEHLTLLGGQTMEGGGLWSGGEAPVLRYLRLAYNFAGRGGGIYVGGAGGRLEASQIEANRATLGGGLYLMGADAASVSGNTLQRNTASKGGGVSLESSAATLSGNAILNNTAYPDGGGAFLNKSAATLSDNAILSNTAGGGSGVYLTHSSAMLNDNTLSNNIAHGDGGGAHLDYSSATLSSNTIYSNTAYHGGGVFLNSSAATLNHNIVYGNMASDGGGTYLWYPAVSLNGNLIYDNIAQYTGGGVYLFGGDTTLINNVIADNQGGCGSGAYVYMAATNVRFIHTTLARNLGDYCSAVYVTGYQWFEPGPSSVALTNTILVSHTVGISVTGRYAVTVNGVLWFGTPVTVSANVTSTVSVQNQYEGDPAFAPDGYHLTAGSAAIDRGVNAGVTTDIDGRTRPYGPAPDLGAVEYVPPASQRPEP